MIDDSLLFSRGKDTVHTKREEINMTYVSHSFKRTSG